MRGFFQPILFVAIVLAVAGQTVKPLVALLGLAWLALASVRAWRARAAAATGEPVADTTVHGADRHHATPDSPGPPDVAASSPIPLNGQLSRWDEAGLWLGSLWALVSGVQVAQRWPDGAAGTVFGFHAWAFSLLVAMTVVAVSAWLRRREMQVLVIWRLMREHPEIDVAQLIHDSHLTRSSLRRAVRYLNNSGRDHFQWDVERDLIHDARLNMDLDVAHDCAGCGGSSSFRWNVRSDRLPDCPYCNSSSPAESIHRERHRLVAGIRHQNRLAARRAAAEHAAVKPFSGPLCVVLFVVYWPALLFYLSRYVPSMLSGPDIVGSDGSTRDGERVKGSPDGDADPT